MMAIERPAVILPLVAEEPAKLIDLVGPMDQPVPEVMADLVPKVAQECPVRLVHPQSPRLALGIVGLGHVDGDDSVQVSGRGGDRPRRAGVEVGKEVERQTALRVPGLARQGELGAEQAIDQPAFGNLQSRPGFARAGRLRLGMTRFNRHDRQYGFGSSTGTAQLQTFSRL